MRDEEGVGVDVNVAVLVSEEEEDSVIVEVDDNVRDCEGDPV